jgi:TetR/AcrR family transcriptional regulator
MATSKNKERVKQRRQPEVTRVRLVEAAIAVIRDRGFEGASIDEIATRAGLTNGAVYSCFANKAELLAAGMAQHFLKIERVVKMIEEQEKEPIDKLKTLMSAFNVLELRKGGIIPQAFGRVRHDPLVGKVCRDGVARIESYLIEWIRQSQENGSIRRDIRPEAFAGLFTRLGTGYECHRAAGVKYVERDAWIECLLHIVESMRSR